MSIPSNWTVVRVTAQYLNPNGGAAQGKVKFDINTPGRIVDPEANAIVVPKSIVAELDAEGRIDVLLPSSNDPDITPAFTWTVREQFLPNRFYSYEIEIPHDISSIDLSHAEEVTSGQSIYRYVKRDGDRLTGYLTLHANPVEDFHAATKQYVDASRASSESHAGNLMSEHLITEDPHGDRQYTRNLIDSAVPKKVEHIVSEPSSNWVIDHNLNTFPEVVLMTSDNERFYSSIYYNGPNSLTVSLAQPITGRAILH